jgi:hypothetical protein
VHHPTTLVHAVCLCHLLSCLRARVYVFFWNRIESYNHYTCNMQETWKSMLQLELPSLLSRSPSFFRARLHVCLLQQEWSKSRLSVRLQGRLHSSFNICSVCFLPLPTWFVFLWLLKIEDEILVKWAKWVKVFLCLFSSFLGRLKWKWNEKQRER